MRTDAFIFNALRLTEQFVAGFEGDELQQGIDVPEGLLAVVRTARDLAQIRAEASDELQRLEVSNIRPDILTFGGTYFNFLEPDKSVIDLVAIAHGLGNVCRFAGHTRQFYSVAQHSVLCSQIVAPEFALAALMHDAAEAYVGDVVSPLKRLLPEYKVIEKRVEAAVFAHFGLPLEMPVEVKRADLVMLATEQRDLMPEHNDEWAQIAGVTPLALRIDPWAPGRARDEFIHRFNKLTGSNFDAGPIFEE